MKSTEKRTERPLETEFIKLKDFDYIELYVGNARQAAHFYDTTFDLKPVAYAGLETGVQDRVSFVVEQRNIRLVLTSALDASSPVARHAGLHGDGVKDIAFTVDDATRAFNETVKRGARPVLEPTALEDEGGKVIKSAIAAYGDTVHSFVERKAYDGAFLPGYRAIERPAGHASSHFVSVDHIAVGVEAGKLNDWIDFYKSALGFHQSHQEDVATEYSAMNSKVVENSTGKIKFPIMEPASGKRRSQIDEYLSFYGGPGAQHIALLTGNIVEAVRRLKEKGIEFLDAPPSYYDALAERVGEIDEDLDLFRRFNILVDRDNYGHLMQVFSKPLQGRPTVFFELIQRKGARGFGGGNIRALYEAIEREQALRSAPR